MTPDELCASCWQPYKPGAAFCAHCGRRRGPEPRDRELGFAIRLYLAMLATTVVTLIWARLGGTPFAVALAMSIVDAVIIFAVALRRRDLVVPTYRATGFGPVGFTAILVAAPAVLVFVIGYVHGLSRAFGIPAEREVALFGAHGLPAAVALIAIAPPLVEELAFRGLIYGALAKTLRRSEAYLLSSLAFALLHISIPALITHLPLGLYFCWLRERSGSLWPSTFAHCCHNVGVIVVESLGWA